MKTSLLALVFCLAVFTGAAYSDDLKPSNPLAPPAAAEVTKESFFETVWRSENLKTGFVQYLILKRSGTVGYSDDKTTTKFTFDGNDIWKIEDGHLLIVWTDGFATEKYPLKGGITKVLKGEKTSKKIQGKSEVVLTRIPVE